MTMTPIELLRQSAPASRPVISLCEGSDPRVVAGALAAQQTGLADVILVGPQAEVEAALKNQNAAPSESVHGSRPGDLGPDRGICPNLF